MSYPSAVRILLYLCDKSPESSTERRKVLTGWVELIAVLLDVLLLQLLLLLLLLLLSLTLLAT